MTGRNHHSVATGVIMELGLGYPGYNSLMPKSAATFAEVLKQNGYNTAWYGKNHNVPDWQTSQAGPFDLWPTGLGFEYFYGFIGGDANQWDPALFENTTPIEPPHNAKDYFFDKDMADHAIARIRLLHAMAPDKPWLRYYATGTAHAPHHAPTDWIAKFKGKFDQGWDKVREETFARQKQMGIIPQNAQLTPRPAGIPAWDSLDADHKKVFARMMEIYAGRAVARRLLKWAASFDAIEETGQLDNTLVIYIQGDNGASAEGSAQGLLNEMSFFNGIPEDFNRSCGASTSSATDKPITTIPPAGRTPWTRRSSGRSRLRRTSAARAMGWSSPGRLRIKDKGCIRTQFHHVIDIAPTILEAAGLQPPTVLNGVPQKPIEGVSMVYTFDDANAPSTAPDSVLRDAGNRAIYNDGWVAATTPPIAPWVGVAQPVDVNAYKWELYHVADDFSEAANLAGKEPAKLRELQDLFWTEAAKYNVLPIDNSQIERMDVSNPAEPDAGPNRLHVLRGT